jgi:adenine-specific DNA-methyltransferase
MGEELLKKTSAANLFTVFREPDIEVSGGKDGYLTVHLNGVDVYDPTTGQIRNSQGTDDVACWFIDTTARASSCATRISRARTSRTTS